MDTDVFMENIILHQSATTLKGLTGDVNNINHLIYM